MNTTRKLLYMPYAKARVEIDEYGAIYLLSYASPVICIDPEGWLYCYRINSATTISHIKAFMKEYGYGSTFSAVKKCYYENKCYNIYTHEFLTRQLTNTS